MSARTYPRIGAVSNRAGYTKAKKLKPSTCHACGAQAIYRIDIQVNWFRGDDEVVSSCEAHKNDIAALLDGLERVRAEQAAKRQAAAEMSAPSAATFTYTPRPPLWMGDTAYYHGGHAGSAMTGVGDDPGGARIVVYRECNLPRHQRAVVDVSFRDGDVRVVFTRDSLRELATRLLNAAADIEQEIAAREQAS